MEEFSQVTSEGGRQLLKDSGILILPEWDIANAMIFDIVRKEKDTQFKTKEEVLQEHKGFKYSDDHQELVIWSIEKRAKTRLQEVSDAERRNSLMVYREEEVDSEKVSRMTKEMVDFGVIVVAKDKNKLLELNAKFEEILKAYEERGNRIHQLESQVAQMDQQLGKRKVGESNWSKISYPCPPVEPFK